MKVIKRGYVKWTDEDGVFHKEPLYDHPDLLASASVVQQVAAEEARRLNEHAEEYIEAIEDTTDADNIAALEALKAAPDSVLTVAEIPTSVLEPVEEAVHDEVSSLNTFLPSQEDDNHA